MNKLKLTLIAIVLTPLFGCGDDSSQPSQQVTQPKANQVQQAPKKVEKKDSFRYEWLSGIEVMSSDTDNMFDKNYYFVIDGSGSMDGSSCEGNEKKIDIAKRAVIDYSKTLDGNNLGLIAFDGSGVKERFALSKDNSLGFQSSVKSIRADSGTPLKTSITLAYEKIKKQASKQGGNGEYNLIIVTDGEANSGEDPKSIVREIGEDSPINITTIGFCLGQGHSLNNKEYVHYYPAKNYDSILKGLSKVQSEGEGISDEEYIQMLNEL